MSELPEILELGPEEEAQRLWQGAQGALAVAADDLVALCQALDLGLRAAEILVVHRLNPVKDEFPATIAVQLGTPDPEVDTHEDAITIPNSLHFTEILDLLSSQELECVAPGLHRGWEDRRFSCRRSRVRAQEVISLSLAEAERRDLLLLSAYRNRIFRAPPPVRVVRNEILQAFPALQRLVGGLL